HPAALGGLAAGLLDPAAQFLEAGRGQLGQQRGLAVEMVVERAGGDPGPGGQVAQVQRLQALVFEDVERFVEQTGADRADLVGASRRRGPVRAFRPPSIRVRHAPSQFRFGMITGSVSYPFAKTEWVLVGSSTTSMVGKRLRISSQMMVSCSSASRLPTQRWMPKPNDRWFRGRGRSMT